MMNLKKLADRAKEATDRAKGAFDERGGTDALKQDVGRARDAASTPGSVKDKALAVREALTHRPEGDEPAAGEASATAEPAPDGASTTPPTQS
jgi:hypothetical protein